MPRDGHLLSVGEGRPSEIVGNQLYQLAATLGLAATRHDTACLPPWDYAPFFSLPSEVFTPCADAIEADTLVPHLDPRCAVYLQDVSTFVDIMPTVRGYLTPSTKAEVVLNEYAEFWALPDPVLGVHVRRGDNVPGQDPATPDKARFHGCPGADYYRSAIELLAPQAASIAVFGDEPDWNRANLPGDYFHVGVPRPKEHTPGWTDPPLDWIDWHLLASCSSFVLSNSSFGIFAALMAGGPATISWPLYGPALDYIDATLMVDERWRRLPC